MVISFKWGKANSFFIWHGVKLWNQLATQSFLQVLFLLFLTKHSYSQFEQLFILCLSLKRMFFSSTLFIDLPQRVFYHSQLISCCLSVSYWLLLSKFRTPKRRHLRIVSWCKVTCNNRIRRKVEQLFTKRREAFVLSNEVSHIMIFLLILKKDWNVSTCQHTDVLSNEVSQFMIFLVILKKGLKMYLPVRTETPSSTNP